MTLSGAPLVISSATARAATMVPYAPASQIGADWCRLMPGESWPSRADTQLVQFRVRRAADLRVCSSTDGRVDAQHGGARGHFG